MKLAETCVSCSHPVERTNVPNQIKSSSCTRFHHISCGPSGETFSGGIDTSVGLWCSQSCQISTVCGLTHSVTSTFHVINIMLLSACFTFCLLAINISFAQGYHHHHHHNQHRKPGEVGSAVVTSTTSTSGDASSRLRHHHHNNPKEGLGEEEDCESGEEEAVGDGQPTKRRCGGGGDSSSSSSCPHVCGEGEKKSNKPICGSDGRLYATHCDLRRWSCLTKSHVYPVNHSLCPHHNHHRHFSGLSSSSHHSHHGEDEGGIGKGPRDDAEIRRDDEDPFALKNNGTGESSLGGGGGAGGEVYNDLEEMQMDGRRPDESVMQKGTPPVQKSCSPEEFETARAKLFELSAEEVKKVLVNGEQRGRLLPFLPYSSLEGVNGESLWGESVWKDLLGDGPEADKDNLIRLIFSSIDQNKDLLIDYTELYTLDAWKVPQRLELNCQLRDFLLHDDSNGDGVLYVTEFFSAFSHLYGVTMISLEKALEWKTVSVDVGRSVILRCDISGYPPTSIIWFKPPHLSLRNEPPHMRLNPDGSLSLVNVQPRHTANYSCRSPRNDEVIQTTSLTVMEVPRVQINPKVLMEYPNRNVSFECELQQSQDGNEVQVSPGQSFIWSWIHNGVFVWSESFSNFNENQFICRSEGRRSSCVFVNATNEQSGSVTCQITKALAAEVDGGGETSSSGVVASDTATLGIIEDPWHDSG